MPTVQSQVRIESTPIEAVWKVVSDFESYPRLMQDVLEVKILHESGPLLTSSWKVLLNGSELNWIEESHLHPIHRIAFEQTEGDLEVYQGEWTLEAVGDDVVVTLEIVFDIGIPSLEELLNPIAIKAIHSNSRQMLGAIQQHSV
jgi:uncharacterized membrane protein